MAKKDGGTQVVVLLMVQNSGVHQLRLAVHPIIYKVYCIQGGAGFLNHQQYENCADNSNPCGYLSNATRFPSCLGYR